MKNCFLIESESYRNKTLEADNQLLLFIVENEVIRMCRAGRPNRKSKLEKGHGKDLYCWYEIKDSKAVGVRWCDSIDDIK